MVYKDYITFHHAKQISPCLLKASQTAILRRFQFLKPGFCSLHKSKPSRC